MYLRSLSYGKAVSMLIVVMGHIFVSFFNNPLWAEVVNAPAVTLEYPYIIKVIHLYFGDTFCGFVIVGAVFFFFMSSGYTVTSSLKKRCGRKFLKHKIGRLFPIYFVALTINFFVSYISSRLYGIEYAYSALDWSMQIFMGLQHVFPNVKVLDLVIWFLGCDLVFYLYASAFSPTCLKNIFKMDIALIFSLVFLNIYGELLLYFFTIENICYMIKAITLSFMILSATILSLKNSKMSTRGGVSFFQYCLFIVVYRIYIIEIGYVDVQHYVSWFLLYFLLFSVIIMMENSIPRIFIFEKLEKMSYVLYICHGYMGYFCVSSFICLGLNRDISCVIAFFVVLLFGYFVHVNFEIPINNRLLANTKSREERMDR